MLYTRIRLNSLLPPPSTKVLPLKRSERELPNWYPKPRTKLAEITPHKEVIRTKTETAHPCTKPWENELVHTTIEHKVTNQSYPDATPLTGVEREPSCIRPATYTHIHSKNTSTPRRSPDYKPNHSPATESWTVLKGNKLHRNIIINRQ